MKRSISNLQDQLAELPASEIPLVSVAYVAGFLDGEGYIGVSSNGVANTPLPKVQITQRHPQVLESIRRSIPVKAYLCRRKNGHCWKLEIKGYKQVHPFLEWVLPHLIVKRWIAEEVLATAPRKQRAPLPTSREAMNELNSDHKISGWTGNPLRRRQHIYYPD